VLRLIINADDLGMNSAVNQRIFALLERGSVTSVTLLMNAPAIEEAAQELRRFPRASFGIHLNVTEFVPLTNHPGLAVLRGPDGALANNVREVHLNWATCEAVYREWCAQVERALTMGIPVSHLDSHRHAHNIPALFLALKRLQVRFGIRRVRLTRNVYRVGERLAFGKHQTKAVWNLALSRLYRTRTTDGFTDFSTFHADLAAGVPFSGTYEVMCHPGHPKFEEETRLLETSWQPTLVPSAQLISYNEL
jgi:predicted glycoside hydrolase/deacetylase ChbG (UPF0249 family)